MSDNRPNLLSNKIIICIPITLKTKADILSSLANKYGTDYLFAGKIFQDTKTNEYCLLDIHDLESQDIVKLVDCYRFLGQEKILNETIEQVTNCSQIIYLTSYKLGYNACLNMAKYAQIFLSVGGITVMVDSAGIVHQKDKWLANYNSADLFDIYSLFVTLVEGDNYYYSCGMQNFAKADVSLDITEEVSLASYVMKVFNYYRLTESVILKDGQTFQPDFECPIYRMQWSEFDSEYAIDNPRNNFYGRWHLSRVVEDLEIDYQINLSS